MTVDRDQVIADLQLAIHRLDNQRTAGLWRVTDRTSPENFAVWSEESAEALGLDRRDRADLCLWMESEEQYKVCYIAHDNYDKRAPVLKAMLRDRFGDVLYPQHEYDTIKADLVRKLRAARRAVRSLS